MHDGEYSEMSENEKLQFELKRIQEKLKIREGRGARAITESPVNNAFQIAVHRIVENTDQLGIAIELLQVKIDPILGPTNFIAKVMDDIPEMSHNARLMNEHADQLDMLIDRVTDMTNRVEI